MRERGEVDASVVVFPDRTPIGRERNREPGEPLGGAVEIERAREDSARVREEGRSPLGAFGGGAGCLFFFEQPVALLLGLFALRDVAAEHDEAFAIPIGVEERDLEDVVRPDGPILAGDLLLLAREAAQNPGLGVRPLTKGQRLLVERRECGELVFVFSVIVDALELKKLEAGAVHLEPAAFAVFHENRIGRGLDQRA